MYNRLNDQTPRKTLKTNPTISVTIGPLKFSTKKREISPIMPVIDRIRFYDHYATLDLTPPVKPKNPESWQFVKSMIHNKSYSSITLEDSEFFISLADTLGLPLLKTQVKQIIKRANSLNIGEKCKELDVLIQIQSLLLNINEDNLDETQTLIENMEDIDKNLICRIIFVLSDFQIKKKLLLDTLIENLNLKSLFKEITDIYMKNDVPYYQLTLIQNQINNSNLLNIFVNDDIEAFTQMASHINFNINENIHLILPNILLTSHQYINLAAYFNAPKCFDFLNMNNANINTSILSKYAIIGGNEDIIHFCESYNCQFSGLLDLAVKYHHNDILEWLYENKNSRNDEPKLINTCISYHNFYALSYLLAKNCNFNNDITQNALHSGNIILAKFCFTISNPNELSDKTDWITHAIKSTNINCVKFALENVGSLGPNYLEPSLLNIACSSGISEIYKLIKEFHGNNENNSSNSVLKSAICGGNLEIVKDVMNSSISNININKPLDGKNNALCLAVMRNNIELVRFLLETPNIDINANILPKSNDNEEIPYFEETDPEYITPLHVACQYGNDDIVKLLLQQKNININALSMTHKYGKFTPLHFAVLSCKHSIVSLLLSHEEIKPDLRGYIKLNWVNINHFSSY